MYNDVMMFETNVKRSYREIASRGPSTTMLVPVSHESVQFRVVTCGHIV
jgi:hypothetical protein